MPVRCPYCGSVVEPLRDARGDLVCPTCRNTGAPVAGVPVAPKWTPLSPPASPGAPASPHGPPGSAGNAFGPSAPPGQAPGKAVAALVLGICALILFPIAILLGPFAIVFGVKALRAIKAGGPGTPGQGMAYTGIALGAVGILVGLVVVMAAVVFVLVSNLGETEAWDFIVDDAGPGGVLVVDGYPGFPSWSEFGLDGTASCRLPSGEVDYGDEIVCTTDGTVILLDAESGQALYNATV